MDVKNLIPKNLEGKNIYIAGVGGFIGSHLAEFYLNLGAKVSGFDNFVTGSQANIDYLSAYPRFDFMKCNIFERLPNLKGKKIDYLFNLASPASPIDFTEIPLEIMRTNSEGVMALLEVAKDKKARFLQASTSEVYGDPEIHPQGEDYLGHVNTLGPRACYDESKRFAETLVMTYLNHYGVDTRIVRIFNTYGPRMRPDDGRVIPNFINQALKNEDITIYGKGDQTRSFCYVSDLVMAMHHVMFLGDHLPYNIGNADEHSVKETAEIIIKTLNSKSKISYQDLPKDDPKKRKPDLSRVKALAGYVPQVSFTEGLQKTSEYFQKFF